LLSERDEEIEHHRRRHQTDPGDDDAARAYSRSLVRAGRGHEYFEGHFKKIKELEKQRNGSFDRAMAVMKEHGRNHPETAQARDAHVHAINQVHAAEHDLGREAHRTGHPVGQYLKLNPTRGDLAKLRRVSSPSGKDTQSHDDGISGMGNPTESRTWISLPPKDSPHHEAHKEHLLHALKAHNMEHTIKDNKYVKNRVDVEVVDRRPRPRHDAT